MCSSHVVQLDYIAGCNYIYRNEVYYIPYFIKLEMNWILYDSSLILSMGVKLVALTLIALLCCSSSGCIFAEDEPEGFDLIVSSSISQGTIVESYENGDLISAEYVSIEFDFSSTKADFRKIGLDLNDGIIQLSWRIFQFNNSCRV